jgi:hypothetical protein
MEADPWTLPTWVTDWDRPHKNYGRTGGELQAPMTPQFKRDQEVYKFEIWLMLSDLEHHANWGA